MRVVMRKFAPKLLRSAAGLLALALVPACTQDDTRASGSEEKSGVAALRAALPLAEQMTIRMPSQAALAPEQATFYAFTRGITVRVNGTVYVISEVIGDVIEGEPSETDGETYAVWGPFQDALSPATWRVRVERQPDGSFGYVVQGWPRNGDAAQAVTVLEGVHVPGAAEDAGSGHWRYDITAAHALDPTTQPGTGAMDVDYSLAGPRTLEVGLTDFQEPGDATSNDTLYRYTEALDGSGTFDFVSNLDIDADSDATRDRRELLQVRSRWLADGPGRADVTATHGDLPAGVQVEVNECWDAAFARSYMRFGFPQSEVAEGDVAACPYAQAEYPQFEGFDANAFADDDLVAALPEPGDLPATPVSVREPTAEPALYFVITRDLIDNTNTHVSKTLADIRALTRLPPSDCTPEGCTWGPWTDWNTRLTTRLDVRRAGDGLFTYQADAKHFGEGEDAWRKLFEGGYSAAEANGDGDGWYALDLAAIADFQGEVGAGRIRVELARRQGRGTINLRADGFVGRENLEPADTRYALVVEADGSGQVSFALPGDIDEGRDGRTALEDLAAITRWSTTGAGQTDVRVTGGDLEAAQVILGLQCWDEHAALTHEGYAQQAEDNESRPAADPVKCVFPDWAEPVFPALGDE